MSPLLAVTITAVAFFGFHLLFVLVFRSKS